jgi:isopentenyl-diphosphate delta-isomerase
MQFNTDENEPHEDTSAQQVETRKSDHIRINVEEDVAFRGLTTGLEKHYLMHQALPEMDFGAVDTTQHIFGKSLSVPLLISSMTGGTSEAYEINRLGAVQLNYGYGVDECMRSVEICQADALILHFNALQEAVQPEGDGNFSGLLAKVEQICKKLPVPVIAKEVGWGIAANTAKDLADAGIAAIDVAGAGGTSWSQVEMFRAPTKRHARVAGAFIDWGIPTAESLRYCRLGAPDISLIASGGIRNGIDVAKCIALGASIVGLAGDFLRAAVSGGVEEVVETAGTITDELRVAMFCSGAGDLRVLSETPLHTRQ